LGVTVTDVEVDQLDTSIGDVFAPQVIIVFIALSGSETLNTILVSSAWRSDEFGGNTAPTKVGGVVSPTGTTTTTGACSTVKLVITTLDPNLLPAKSLVAVLSTVAVQNEPYIRFWVGAAVTKSDTNDVALGITVPPQVKMTLAELNGSLALKLMVGDSETPFAPFAGEIIFEVAAVAIVGGTISPGTTTTGACSTVKLVITALDPNLLPAMSFV
jgi:hypothetical protein